ncbi:Hpt domain-containing protein, partial [Desulfobacterales bacterium HSG17]|nr:Hpt domain-containing protein [Desulfobacterales bacterium HSG17]
IAHTIKGVAGSIGADDLQQNSGELEAALKERNESLYEKLLSGFTNSLQKVMQGLTALAADSEPEENTSARTETVDLDSIRPVLDRLHKQLEGMDPDAEETAAILNDKLGTGPQQDLLKKLQMQVDDFEFEEADETLTKLREILERC